MIPVVIWYEYHTSVFAVWRQLPIYRYLHTNKYTVSYDTWSTKRVPLYRKSSYKVLRQRVPRETWNSRERRVNASANVIVKIAIRLRTWSNKTVRFVVVVGKVRGARSYVYLHACCDSQVLSLGMAFEFTQTYLYSGCCPQVYFIPLAKTRYYIELCISYTFRATPARSRHPVVTKIGPPIVDWDRQRSDKCTNSACSEWGVQ